MTPFRLAIPLRFPYNVTFYLLLQGGACVHRKLRVRSAFVARGLVHPVRLDVVLLEDLLHPEPAGVGGDRTHEVQMDAVVRKARARVAGQVELGVDRLRAVLEVRAGIIHAGGGPGATAPVIDFLELFVNRCESKAAGQVLQVPSQMGL